MTWLPTLPAMLLVMLVPDGLQTAVLLHPESVVL